MKGDYDVQAIVDKLKKEEYYDFRSWHTVLMKDEEGEHYVIRDIYIDKDDDVIFKIRRL